jgi:hypothetical protein
LSSATLEVRNTVSAGDEDFIGVKLITDRLQENDKMLGYAIVNSALHSVQTILESLVETVKILQDQDHLSVRLDNMECLIGKKINVVSNTNKNATHLNARRMDLNSKSFINSAEAQTQESKIQTVINHYATLENQQDENQIQCHNYGEKSVNAKRAEMSVQQLPSSNKVLIIGGSHARGLAANLQSEHKENFEVIGNVMPGAGLHIITQAAKNDIRSLNQKIR